MKTLLVPSLFIFLYACSSSKQGKVVQGKDGKIESAKITAKCSPPQKSYAKEIEAKLKAEMDSLKFTPSATFDASFNQKVIKLREYSYQGLDLDLLTFRICEMANNRGFTSEQTSSLIEKAIRLWRDENKMSLQQTIISNNQSGGITAGNVFIEPPQRALNSSFKQDLLKFLNSLIFDSIDITSVLGDSESFTYANQINDFLKSILETKKIEGVGQAVFSNPIKGVIIDTANLSKSKQIKIIVGSRV